MPTTVTDVLAYAEELLDAGTFDDYCPVGLQVAGRATHVTRIATSVSSTLDAFRSAAGAGAQLLLCHHGLFWRSTPQVVNEVMRERLATLFDAGITLAAYHLPLDAHPRIGNNALLADALDLQRDDTPFMVHGNGVSIGIVGSLAGDGTSIGEFAARVRDAVGGREPLVLGATPASIRRVAICSGGAASAVVEAAGLGCDVFVTGEPSEETHHLARELGIAFVAAGHHATEVGGVRALGEHLAEHFGLEHAFLDTTNPV